MRREVKENLVRAEIWKPPENGVVKINVDGAFCEEGKEAGIGTIGRIARECFWVEWEFR